MSSVVFQDYESTRAQRSLAMLLIDRQNEFREIANAIGYSTRYDNWEEFVLRFSLEFDDCFVMWSEGKNVNDHNRIHKCMTLMSQIAHDKSNMTQITKLQNIAYRIACDFKVIYNKLD